MGISILLHQVLNETLNFILSSTSLTKGQKILLGEIPTELGVQCMLSMWRNYSYNEIAQGTFCNAVWDDVYCWPPIRAGTEINRLCSETFRQVHPHFALNMQGRSKRECLQNGTWAEGSKSDVTECRKSYEVFLKREDENKFFVSMAQHTLFYGSIASLLCLGVSLAIFSFFRCLWCDRVTVNINLILSLVLRFIMLLIISEPYILDQYLDYRDVDILCETIKVLFLFSTVASIAWMFIQGLFINISLSASMFPAGNKVAHLKAYYIIGWVVPAILTLAYTIAMLLKENQEKCWKRYLEMNEMWILLAPITVALVGNGLFFMNILRIFMKKVWKSRKQNSLLLAAAKATALLFPVLGLNNLIVFYNPDGDLNKYFVAINTFFGSTQGIFVSIVHCFVNKKVIAAISRALKRIKTRRNWNSNRIQAIDRFQNQNSLRALRTVEISAWKQNGQNDCNNFENAV